MSIIDHLAAGLKSAPITKLSPVTRNQLKHVIRLRPDATKYPTKFRSNLCPFVGRAIRGRKSRDLTLISMKTKL